MLRSRIIVSLLLHKNGLYKSRNHENPNLVPSISRARKILKWNPKVKIEKGVSDGKVNELC